MKIDWDAFQASFYDFLPNATILSKDDGRVKLQMYDAQRYFFDEIFDGLRKDIHWFVTAKGRQLGITTGCLLFDVFYAGAVPDVQGVIVFDGDGTKEKFRKIIGDMTESLPLTHRLPLKKGGNNRQGLVFENGNMMDYLVAGTKKGQGNLGRGRAYNFCHATECAYFGDEDAVESFLETLSDRFEYRLMLFESTGNGYNLFHGMWEDALEDTISKKAIFVTWWRKRTYSYAKGTPLFKRYGWQGLSAEERDAVVKVEKLYGHKITLEQWAWYRHQSDPRATADSDPSAVTSRELMSQEHPHTPEDVFRGTGSPFIPGQYLSPALARAQKAMFKGYRFYLGDNMAATKIDPVKFVSQAQLKVWQEPAPNGVYIVGADSAYGASEAGDGFCCQIVRCYADKIVQVAEFNDRNIQPYQFAWIVLYLCGWYGNCRYVLELGSSGEAVWTEMRNVKRMIEDGTLTAPRENPNDPTEAELMAEHKMRNMYNQVRQYMYRRADSLGGGYNMHMKTSLESKFTFMTQFADRFMMGEFEINSIAALKEMQALRKDGRSIQPEGKKKDDRPVTLGLCTRGFMDFERRDLIARNATFEIEQAKVSEGGDDLTVRFMSGIMQREARLKQMRRRTATRQAKGGGWSW